jgi:hypothetical protein
MAISAAQFTGIANKKEQLLCLVQVEATKNGCLESFSLSGILDFRRISYIPKLHEGFFQQVRKYFTKVLALLRRNIINLINKRASKIQR